MKWELLHKSVSSEVSNLVTKYLSSSSVHPFLTYRACNRCIRTAASFELDRVNHEGPEINQEVEVQPAEQEEPEEEVECPNHEPASFVKGKPRSILSLPL